LEEEERGEEERGRRGETHSVDTRAVDGFTDEREVERAKLSEFEVRRRRERKERRVQSRFLCKATNPSRK